MTFTAEQARERVYTSFFDFKLNQNKVIGLIHPGLSNKNIDPRDGKYRPLAASLSSGSSDRIRSPSTAGVSQEKKFTFSPILSRRLSSSRNTPKTGMDVRRREWNSLDEWSSTFTKTGPRDIRSCTFGTATF